MDTMRQVKLLLAKRDQQNTVAKATRSERIVSVSEGGTGSPTPFVDISGHINNPVLDHPDNSVTDNKIGERIVDDSIVMTTNEALLSTILGFIGYNLKNITGKESWLYSPATDLQQAYEHMNNTSIHGGSHTRWEPLVTDEGFELLFSDAGDILMAEVAY